jgi:NAD(P)-dependent dehydrogenase (short-subunit alcohol dehydrogenase family)
VAASCGATAVPGDAATEEGVAALIAAARAELGEIDLYCANAGIARGGGPAAPESSWADSWDVNVMAHVRAARLLTGPWVERGSGHLICTVSAAGLLSMVGSAPYSVTKHAALAFAEWMALTYAHQGITVQAICPQGVRTGMLPGAGDGTGTAAGSESSASAGAFAGTAEAILGAGAIQPEAVADAVIEGMADGRFLILPHPDVAAMYARRAEDPDRWLAGMNKLHRRSAGQD